MIFGRTFLCILVLVVVEIVQPSFLPDTFCVQEGQIVQLFERVNDQEIMDPVDVSFPGEIFIIVDIIYIGGVTYSLTHKNNWWVRGVDIQSCNPIGPLEMLDYRNKFGNSRVSLTTYTAAVCMNLRRYPTLQQYDLTLSRDFLQKLNDAIDINGLQSFNLLPFLFFTSQVAFESNSFNHWESQFVPHPPGDPCTTTPEELVDYKGRGPLKIEGKCDYLICDLDIGLDVTNNFYRPSHIDYGFSTSMWKFLNRFVDVNIFEFLSDEFWNDGLTPGVKLFYDGLSEYMLNDWEGYEELDRGSVAQRRFHFLHCTISAILLQGEFPPDKITCSSAFGCGNVTEGF